MMKALLFPAMASVIFQDGQRISGTQSQPIITLAPAKTPHQVTGHYVVPPGTTLVIEAGTALEFQSKSSLTVGGSLQIKGTEKEPVLLTGKSSSSASWKGIILNEAEKSQIENVRVRGAEIGIYIFKCTPVILSSIFARNQIGMKMLHAAPIVKNCLMTENSDDGVSIIASNMTLDRCTVSRNGGRGIFAESASPLIAWCTVTENRVGGIHNGISQGRTTAQKSIIFGNKEYDVYNESPDACDFKGNWWGTDTTKILQKKGETANVRTIQDNRNQNARPRGPVYLSEWLENEPQDCGSTLKILTHWKEMKQR